MSAGLVRPATRREGWRPPGRRLWTLPSTIAHAVGDGGFEEVCIAARLPQVLVVLVVSLMAWLGSGVGDCRAAAQSFSQPAEAWAVEAAFREAFQLWADERFDVLWSRGMLASRYRVSREAFIRGMRHRMVKPTCCWGQLQNVQVHLQTAEEALVEAQVGVDVKTLGTTVVRSMAIYLRREEGVWRVALEDFLTRPEDGPIRPGDLW